MTVKELEGNELPSSDLPEIVHRLNVLKGELEEMGDDWTRQEMYDRIGYSTVVIHDVMQDLIAIERVIMAVVDA